MSRAQAIFEQIVELPTGERLEALDAACGDDPSVKAEVIRLLEAYDNAGEFLGNPTVDFGGVYAEPPEQAGATIGRYKLLEKIGQGGFGDVFMAQQLEPVKRRVALKIIKLGMDTKQVVARFEAERQALALMDHPNIAQVLDGGATESGRPYFVMELVRGDPITTYCDRGKLSTTERLQLFQQVCRAVQHAHQKGVIHRDIKPSNVLVTIADGEPLVKNIDFGIAKATNTELTEKTLFTEFRQLVGTPQYMSPEQAERSGVDIDTRSDIYSLGVLLYEMLTGRTPLNPEAMKVAVWEDLKRMIVDDEPTRPSLLLTSLGPDSEVVAASHSTPVAQLATLLKGDLDWIVLKALDKDRKFRYSAASELADDIQRFLNDEEVLARPPSYGYRLRKLVRRNKATVAAASAVFVALLAGLFATSATSVWAIAERDKARQAEAAAVAATERVTTMLAMSGAVAQEPAEVRKLVAKWFAEIAEAKQTGAADETTLLEQECQLAAWWLTRGGGRAAAEKIEQLYPQAKEKLGIEHPEFFNLLNAHLVAHIQSYPPPRIADLFSEYVASARVLHADHYESFLPQLAAALHQAGRDEAATEAIEEYLELRKTSRPDPINPPVEKMRLRGAIRDLREWGDANPTLMDSLDSVLEGLPEITAT
ncbi:MAG: serine/threonine-protein kinase [Planctomycetota bacterium]